MNMLLVVFVLVALNVSLASECETSEVTKLYHLENADELVDAFAAFRNNEGLQQFAAAVDDLTLLYKTRPTDGFDFVKLYLGSKTENFLDALRKAYRFCSKKGNEHLMNRLKEFIEYDVPDELWLRLLHAMPYLPDFKKKREIGLVNLLNKVRDWACCELMFKIWPGNPDSDPRGPFWEGIGARESKKYYLAMLKYELVSAPHEVRVKMIEKAANCLGMQDLLAIEIFLVERFGGRYSVGDIDKLVLGARNTWSISDAVGHLYSNLISFVFPKQPGPLNNLPFDIWERIILNLDWRTVMYSMPYINKALNRCITGSRCHLDCPDLKNHLREKAKVKSPEHLFVFEKPWSTIYPTFSKFLTHYFLHNVPNKIWLDSLIGFLQEKENGNALLLSKFTPPNGQHPSGFSIENLTRILNSLVTSEQDKLYPILDRIPQQLMVLLMGKVENSNFFFEYFDNINDEDRLCYLCVAVLKADELDWPASLIALMEKKFMNIFNIRLSLPFHAKNIQKLSQEQLLSIVKKFDDSLIVIKIFNALLEVDSEFDSILSLSRLNWMLNNEGLNIHPMAMTPQQFGVLIKWAIQSFGYSFGLQSCLSNFMSNITGSDY